MPTRKDTENSLLKEIDRRLAKSGKSFGSAIREYHGWSNDHGECNDDSESEARRWVEKFKKYRSRLGDDPESQSYRELSKFLQYLKDESPIQPQPLLDLVQNDPICEEMKRLSATIREQVIREEDSRP